MKLTDIDPAALSRDVGNALRTHLARFATALPPGLTLHVVGDDVQSIGLALTAADLCRFAQTGDCADWGDASGAIDAAQSIVEGLYGRPADHLEVADDAGTQAAGAVADGDDDPAPAWWERIDGDTALGVVVRAGLARAWAQTGGPDIPLTWLAALAGLTPARMRQLVAAGELRATVETRGSARVGMVEALEARRFLTARGLRF